MAAVFKSSDKVKVIEFCKHHIVIEDNGYCSLFYAAKTAVPDKEFDGADHRRAFIKSCSSLITKNNEYRIKETHPNGDYDIERDPNYRKKGYFDKHPTQEKIFIALLSAVFGLAASLVVTDYQRQVQKSIDKEQDQLIKELSDSVQAIKLNKP